MTSMVEHRLMFEECFTLYFVSELQWDFLNKLPVNLEMALNTVNRNCRHSSKMGVIIFLLYPSLVCFERKFAKAHPLASSKVR